jgi:hypothetical protein
MKADASGVGSNLKNLAGFSEVQRARLGEDLFQLYEVEGDLPDAAMRYVMDGEGADVLLKLSASADPGKALRLAGCDNNYAHKTGRTARAKFFDATPADADAAALHRLAEVYEAAARPARSAHWKSPLGLPDWLGLILYEAAGDSPNVYSHQKTAVKFPSEAAERLSVAGGLPADVLVRAVVMSDLKDYNSRYRLSLVTSLSGWPAMAARHAAVIHEGLGAKEAERRVHVLELIATTGIDPAPFGERVTELAVSPLKTVRQAAVPLLSKISEAGTFLRARAETGTNEERALAVQALWVLKGEEARAFLTERAEKDPAARVKALISELLVEQSAVAAAGDSPAVLPTVQPVAEKQPLSDAAKTAFAALLSEGWQAQKRHHERYPQWKLSPEPTESDLAKLLSYLQGELSDKSRLLDLGNVHFHQESALKFAARPDVSLLHLVRIAEWMGHRNEYFRQHMVEQLVVRHYRSIPPGFSLRDLAAVLKAVGRSETEVHAIVLKSAWHGAALLELAPEHIWPYYAEHADLLAQTWESKDGYSFYIDARRRVVFKVLAMFPELPPRYVRMCWEIAFNGSKKERPMAQAALNGVAGKEQRILASLTAGKAEHRAIAADWLGRIGYRDAIPEIRKALTKEKNELTAGAMMTALETLGVPLDEFISAEGLLKEAQTLIARGIPKDLAWFSFDLMPKVRWAGSGRPVRREILQWMILQSDKLGSPEPGPRLRQYTKRFDRADAEAFGQYVLESWIGQDTVPHTHEQAHEHAEKIAAMMTQWQQRAPQYYKGTRDQWYRDAYNAKIAEPVGSANGEKGILAVAGACCGGRVAAPVERYLKTYYGYRVHQCKALLQMLSWVEHPSAIQVLLSVANRFRTAGIRKEADRLVQALAERKDWTVDELADRTIPTGGFEDETGLVVDYGARKFTATLDAEMNVVLKNEEGKAIKALPAPRQDEDAEKAKAAKKALSAAKKEIESVLKLQRERLYEAMCTQRSWSFSDWDQFLNKHPVVRHYCQRLVWGVAEVPPANGTDYASAASIVNKTFRPLTDGTLTDTNDDEVTIGPDERVVVAHESRVEPAVSKAWLQHFADYNVAPLFEQFGKSGYRPPEDKRDESVVADFRGHLLESFRLRGRLTKLGYTRGAAEDGGWFMTYHKHFASLGITATVEFTGSPLPEENRTVAITDLYFARSRGEKEASSWGGDANRLTLAKVPPVLLSECYNDVRHAAAEGTGFDPDWEKKSQY